MRRAEWRRQADNPKTLLGWWWRSVAARVRLVFAFGPVAVAYLAALAGAGWVWMAIALANFAFQCTRPWRNDFDRLKTRLSEPPLGERFLNEVVYRREGVVLGRDTLAYTFLDSWLVGEGLCSEFALRPQDVERLKPSTKEAPAFAEKAAGVLELRDGGQIVLRRPDHAEWSALERWHEGDRPEGEPTFPPARAHPQERARWSFWGGLGTGLIFVPSLIAAYLHLGGRYGEVRMFSGLLAFGLAWFAGRRLFRLGEITIAAEREKPVEWQAPTLRRPEEVQEVRVD